MTVPRPLVLLVALVAGSLCATLVACAGGDDEGLLPSGRAEAMVDELDRVQRAVRNGDCDALGERIDELQSEVNGLSADVDARLRSRLQEGVGNLAQISPVACLERAQTETQPTQTAPEPQPETTMPQTTPETTTQEPPAQTTTEPPAETQPQDQTPPPAETVPQDPGGATAPETIEPGGTGGAEPQP